MALFLKQGGAEVKALRLRKASAWGELEERSRIYYFCKVPNAPSMMLG
jgi:hypothetical protein